MPIRLENKHRYPKDWKLRSRFVREYRAGNKCEWCGVPNYAVGYRDDQGKFRPAYGNLLLDCAGIGHQINGDLLSYRDARDYAELINQSDFNGPKHIVIVLTVAHVYDHRPEAASLLNLAALCQRCHNMHDLKMRQRNRKLNANKTLALF